MVDLLGSSADFLVMIFRSKDKKKIEKKTTLIFVAFSINFFFLVIVLRKQDLNTLCTNNTCNVRYHMWEGRGADMYIRIYSVSYYFRNSNFYDVKNCFREVIL